jgi:hypothetical protein
VARGGDGRWEPWANARRTRPTNSSAFASTPCPSPARSVGLLLFAAQFPLLYWNEGRAVTEALTLDEGLKHVSYVDDAATLEPRLVGKLVHVTGPVTVETLGDADFGVAVPALRLTRDVEMWQYRERRATSKGTDATGREVTRTSVTYEPEWSAARIPSDGFEDARYRGRNPPAWPVRGVTQLASSAAIGAYRLPRSVVETLGNAAPVDLTDPAVSAVGKLLAAAGDGSAPPLHNGLLRLGDAAARLAAPPTDGEEAEGGGDHSSPHQQQHKQRAVAVAGAAASAASAAYRSLAPVARGMALATGDGRLYTGAGGPADPAPGDVRVGFTAARPGGASVIARLDRGGRLAPFIVPSTGRELLLAYDEEGLTPRQMVDRAHAANAVKTWVLRGVGWALAVVGLALVLQPAAVAPTWIPLVGALAGDVVGCGVALVALVVGTTTALATAAAAWLAARPLLAGAVLAACGGVLLYTLARGRSTAAAAAAAARAREEATGSGTKKEN